MKNIVNKPLCAIPVYCSILGLAAITKPVLASCTSGEQCTVDGNAEISVSDAAFQASGSGGQNAALVASHGGSLTGSGIKATALGNQQYGAWIAGGSKIALGQESVIRGYRGVFATGNDSTFTMTGGVIEASHDALEVSRGARASLDNVKIDFSGVHRAVFLTQYGNQTSNIFTMTGGSIDSAGGAVQAVGDNNHITLTRVAITTNRSNSISSDAGTGSNSSVTLNGGTTIKHRGDMSAISTGAGWLYMDDAHVVMDGTNSTAAISVHGTATGAVPHMEAKNFSVHTTGNNIFGMQLSYGSQTHLEHGSIATQDTWAHGIVVSSDTDRQASLTADHLQIVTHGANARGVENMGGNATLTDSHISVHGQNAIGIDSDSINAGTHAITRMQGGSIRVSGADGRGAQSVSGAELYLDNVSIETTASSTDGVLVGFGASAEINNSTVQVQGNGRGMRFYGTNTPNRIDMDTSTVTATDAGAVAIWVQGKTNTLNLGNSTISGDRLAVATGQLVLNANNSHLFGHTRMQSNATLTMNLQNGTHWTLRPSAGGTKRSDVTFLNLEDASRIVFDPASTERQMLVVGAGDRGGNTAVYNAPLGGHAHIVMNTRLDAGGALGLQQTDRLIINGDANGTTLLTVSPIADSPGALTGNAANEGISLVQVYGNAHKHAFALAGDYVAVGPWQYRLFAFDPGASNPDQRVLGNGPFWDFRLQSAADKEAQKPDPVPEPEPAPEPIPEPAPEPAPEPIPEPAPAPAPAPALVLVPQAPSYLIAPVALFQAGLLDVASLHRRTGPGTASGDTPAQDQAQREFFLRSYSGDYHYRSHSNPRQFGYNASTRYTAIQGGGNVWGMDTVGHRLRAGVAANVGSLSFEPDGVGGSRKTRMSVWSVAPTFTWQGAAGGYIDTIVSYGRFKGDVSTQARGKTTTLKGKRLATSVEFGMDMQAGSLTVQPQVQAVYQRLSFDRRRDVDYVEVNLGTPAQWTLRAGGKVRKTFTTASGASVQVHGKAHVSHTPGSQSVRLAQNGFALGKMGTTVEAGLGIAARLSGGKAVIHADVTRQQRVGHAGHQGWAANLGAKILF